MNTTSEKAFAGGTRAWYVNGRSLYNDEDMTIREVVVLRGDLTEFGSMAFIYHPSGVMDYGKPGEELFATEADALNGQAAMLEAFAATHLEMAAKARAKAASLTQPTA